MNITTNMACFASHFGSDAYASKNRVIYGPELNLLNRLLNIHRYLFQ